VVLELLHFGIESVAGLQVRRDQVLFVADDREAGALADDSLLRLGRVHRRIEFVIRGVE